MISIVLFGRNDSHGYNLAKRAAIGLNCMVEVLTDSDDEILFVDYNCPNDFAAFPESIEPVAAKWAGSRQLYELRLAAGTDLVMSGSSHRDDLPFCQSHC